MRKNPNRTMQLFVGCRDEVHRIGGTLGERPSVVVSAAVIAFGRLTPAEQLAFIQDAKLERALVLRGWVDEANAGCSASLPAT